MSPLPHYDFEQFAYIIRGNGKRSKRYKHWCAKCLSDRGFAYKNKILKESLCHKCTMKRPETLAKIAKASSEKTHTTESKRKISLSLYKRYGSSPLNRRLARNLRSRLNQAIRNSYKTGSAVTDLGCTVDELKTYLEGKFVSGMSWSNYGEWQIDHIKPLCTFSLYDPIELKKACHYTNLQPLWAHSNLEKRKHDGTFRI